MIVVRKDNVFYLKLPILYEVLMVLKKFTQNKDLLL